MYRGAALVLQHRAVSEVSHPNEELLRKWREGNATDLTKQIDLRRGIRVSIMDDNVIAR